MADNYLEKKYEELRQGKPVVRRNSPSLDTLLKRVSATSDAPVAGTSAPDAVPTVLSAVKQAQPTAFYAVKQAQLDAIVRSAGLVGCGFSVETAETAQSQPAFIRLTSHDGPLCLGQLVLAVRLKAAELSLCSSVSADSSETVTVSLFR